MRKPRLSICIPTFNRCLSLQSLLSQFALLDSCVLKQIEICISDNCSDDDTAAIVKEFSAELPIVYQQQSHNIGASKNLISVLKMARGDWVQLSGDDDSCDADELQKLLNKLEKTDKPNTWFLLKSTKTTTPLLTNLRAGPITYPRLLEYLSLNGSIQIGFIGTHVLPLSITRKLNIDDVTVGWPHLSILVSEISRLSLEILAGSVIVQNQTGENLSWRAQDWLDLSLKRIQILSNPSVYVSDQILRIFVLRELFSLEFVKQLISCRAQGADARVLHSMLCEFFDSLPINLGYSAGFKFYLLLIVTYLPTISAKFIVRLGGRKKLNSVGRDSGDAKMRGL